MNRKESGIMQQSRQHPEALASSMQIPLAALVDTEVPRVEENEPVEAALQQMMRHGLRYAIVTSDGRFRGLVSERDIRLALPSRYAPIEEQQAALATLRVDQICIERPYTVGPQHDASDAVAMLVRHRVGALPVVDGETPVGLVTVHNVAQLWLNGGARQLDQPDTEQAVDPKLNAQWVS
jgi:CBS domain-containing protein